MTMSELTGLTDLGVVDAAAALASREVSAVELTAACLTRIEAIDGAHSHDGDPESVSYTHLTLPTNREV